jgi:hypothetical protein
VSVDLGVHPVLGAEDELVKTRLVRPRKAVETLNHTTDIDMSGQSHT